jgi:Tfp pilus assembly protein PilO
MGANQRNLLFGLAGVILLGAFWFLILAPKRHDASAIEAKVGELRAQVADQEQQIEFARQAKTQFSSNYQHIVALGKAAPENADTASFLVELSALSKKSGIEFKGITLEAGSAEAAPAPATGVGAAPAASSQPSATEPPPEGGASSTTASTTATAAPATEASASTLAIGASVGPAGLSVLKYSLDFSGDFFQIADFLANVDKLVSSSDGRVVVNGRLSTVDGFSFTGSEAGFPALKATVAVTTYLTPAGQGLTAGASPTAPATTIPGGAPQLASSGTGTTP